MRLLIDYSAAMNQGAGIGRYARGVVPIALAALAGLPTVEMRLFYAADGRGPARFEREALANLPRETATMLRRAPVSRKRLDQLWHRAGFPIGIRQIVGPADVVYSPDFFTPAVRGAARVPTVHDLAFMVCPERAPDALVRFLLPAVRRELRAAAEVIAVSQTTRRDLVERMGVAEDRIHLVPNGVDERFFQATPPAAALRRRLGLPDHYLLMVGTLEPRKNHVGAFAAVRLLGDGLGLPLVVAGRPGWQVEPIHEAAADLVKRGSVRFLDYVPDDDLPSLYAGAASLVYPSWYEGFGLPVLEALAVGIPTVISSAPALVEVAGQVAEIADPGQPEAIAAAIEGAVGAEARSDEARQRRRAVARTYSWHAAGKELDRLLRGLAR